MRPSKIRYDNVEPHFFDLTNGEVLAGQAQYDEYLATHEQPDMVVPLGTFLREGDERADYERYEIPDRSRISNTKLIAYGKWVREIVDPPRSSYEKDISKDILTRAAAIGVGPRVGILTRKFTTLHNFYVKIGAFNTRRVGNFKDYEVTDFVDYVRELGATLGRRPTATVINAIAREDVTKPSSSAIYERCRHVGGLEGVLDWAGFVMVRRWSEEDYIEWGARFMEANEGDLPTVDAVRFLAGKQLGPGLQSIYDHFDSVPAYQHDVSREYWRNYHERVLRRKAQLDKMQQAYIARKLPPNLFLLDPAEPSLEGPLPRQETISRYAKFMLAKALLPTSSPAGIAGIVLSQEDSYTRGVRKRNPSLTAAEIEQAGLMEGLFDDIWPAQHGLRTEQLTLGEEYAAYQRERQKKHRQAQQKRRKRKTSTK